jgi:hypothetical protein
MEMQKLRSSWQSPSFIILPAPFFLCIPNKHDKMKNAYPISKTLTFLLKVFTEKKTKADNIDYNLHKI